VSENEVLVCYDILANEGGVEQNDVSVEEDDANGDDVSAYESANGGDERFVN
jgi:hypothetical protein